MFVCIYVAIYFRAWYDGCGHENVRIFPGSAPGFKYNEQKLNISKHIIHDVFYLQGSKYGQTRLKFSCEGHLLSNSRLPIG